MNATILTQDQIRGQIATLGMVLFAIRWGRPVPDKKDQTLTVGVTICELLIEGQRLSPSSISSFNDLEVMEVFQQLQRLHGAVAVSEIIRKVPGVKQTLLDLLHLQSPRPKNSMRQCNSALLWANCCSRGSPTPRVIRVAGESRGQL
jgi:hypothetical protein